MYNHLQIAEYKHGEIMRFKTVLFTVIILVVVGIIIAYSFPNDTENLVIHENESTTLYTLKDYNGQIALFINNNAIPAETYNIFTNSLPESDKKNLEKGITANNEKELIILLEDYLG